MSNQQSAISNSQSTFTIVTPSFRQLDWLRLCVASVRDQVEEKAEAGMLRPESEALRVTEEVANRGSDSSTPLEQSAISNQQSSSEQSAITNHQSPIPTLRVEHIIQDAGSPGIEEFAREVGADFYRDGTLIFTSQNQKPETGKLKPEIALRNAELPGNPKSKIQNLESRYRIAVYCESDSGMYDAINRGLAKSSGEICAWLNCDEQYLEGTLRKVRAIFQKKPTLDVLLGDALLVDSTLKPVCYRRIMVPNSWHTRLDHLHSLSCAMFFRPSALPSPPLEPRWKVIGDAVLMDHFLGSGKRIKACGELLSAYAFTGRNLSSLPSGELETWHAELGWPPRWLGRVTVLHHRIRRLFSGAYTPRILKTSLFDKTGERCIFFATKISGRWPESH